MTSDETWRTDNRLKWDERVAIHLAAEPYSLDDLRAGRGKLYPIEEAEIGPVAGLRLLHLQCHFGRDTLTLATRGANCVGLDFSGAAIKAARALAQELDLPAHFVQADLYDTPDALAHEPAFDRVFVTWGAINWLPDIRRWAEIVAGQLAPGGCLYFAESHPSALVFDDETRKDGETLPNWFLPYFYSDVFSYDDASDYADPSAALTHTRGHEWMHTIGSIITALIDAGLRIDWLHEHDSLPWPMFSCLVCGEDGMYRWPDKPWLPLSVSLQATKPA